MIAGIITTPQRQQYLPGLLASVAPFADKTHVYCDLERRGAWFNQERILREVLPTAGRDEPVLMLDDDMELAPGWLSCWQRVHAQAKADTYVLFTRARYLLKPEHVRRGYAQGLFKSSLYTCAIIYLNQPDLADRVAAWFAVNRQRISPSKVNHYDMVIEAYFASLRKEYVVLVPTLAEHRGTSSTLGHRIGGSILYKGGTR